MGNVRIIEIDIDHHNQRSVIDNHYLTNFIQIFKFCHFDVSRARYNCVGTPTLITGTDPKIILHCDLYQLESSFQNHYSELQTGSLDMSLFSVHVN